MREKYESLSLATLKDLAKARGLKGISGLKKAELIERMLEEDEKDKQKAEKAEEKSADRPAENRSASRGDRHERSDQHRQEGHRKNMKNVNANHSDMNQVKLTEDNVKELSANTGDREIHDIDRLDSGITAHGILEVMPDGYGFIRCENYLPGDNDVYVSPSQIRRFNLKTGDILEGNTRIKTQQEKFSALLYLSRINDIHPAVAARRPNFEDLTPIFPNERLAQHSHAYHGSALPHRKRAERYDRVPAEGRKDYPPQGGGPLCQEE